MANRIYLLVDEVESISKINEQLYDDNKQFYLKYKKIKELSKDRDEEGGQYKNNEFYKS